MQDQHCCMFTLGCLDHHVEQVVTVASKVPAETSAATGKRRLHQASAETQCLALQQTVQDLGTVVSHDVCALSAVLQQAFAVPQRARNVASAGVVLE